MTSHATRTTPGVLTIVQPGQLLDGVDVWDLADTDGHLPLLDRPDVAAWLDSHGFDHDGPDILSIDTADRDGPAADRTPGPARLDLTLTDQEAAAIRAAYTDRACDHTATLG